MSAEARSGGYKPRPTGGPRGAGGRGGQRRTYHRKKVCRFCTKGAARLDYKDVKTLKYFVTERGKIIPRRISGNCARHQRVVGLAIKRARNVALLPYASTGM